MSMLAPGVKPLTELKRKPRTGSSKTPPRIFDKKRDDLVAALEKSIEQAKGRYVENKRASYKEGVQVPHEGGTMDKIEAAPNWRVQLNGATKDKPYQHPVLEDDQDDRDFPAESVFVYIKAGRTKAPVFQAEDGARMDELRISSDDLVAQLEFLRDLVKDWTPETSAEAKIFHYTGVIDSISPVASQDMQKGKKWAHCAEQDRIVRDYPHKVGNEEVQTAVKAKSGYTIGDNGKGYLGFVEKI